MQKWYMCCLIIDVKHLSVRQLIIIAKHLSVRQLILQVGRSQLALVYIYIDIYILWQ